MKITPYINLTELWQEGEYIKVGEIIRSESWTSSQVAEFCYYFVKHLGLKDFSLLYKFL